MRKNKIAFVCLFLFACEEPSSNEDGSSIIGGKRDKDDVFTGVAKLVTKVHRGKDMDLKCTGVLVSDRHVLTAAHCVTSCREERSNSCDGAGSTKVTFTSNRHGPQTIEGIVNVNPGYSVSYTDATCESGSFQSDIAIITLNESPSADYHKIPLWSTTSNPDIKPPESGDLVNIVGFGQRYCSRIWDGLLGGGVRRYADSQIESILKTKGLITVRSHDGDFPWKGDSGGPLIDLAADSTVVGVVSLSNGACEDESSVSVAYTSTQAHSAWLNEMLNNCEGKTYCCGESQCTDLKTDAANCGACGSSCTTGQACVNGACRTPLCTPNWSCTPYSACSSGMKTRTCSDLNNCGTTAGKPPVSALCPERTNIRRRYGSNGQGCSNPTADWDHCHTIGTSTICLAGQSASVNYEPEIPATNDQFWVMPLTAASGSPDTATIEGVSMSRLDACYHAASTQHVLEPQDQLKIEGIENSSSQGINGWTCARVGYVRTGSAVAGDPYMIPTYRIKIPNKSSRFVSTINSPSDSACDIRNTGIAWWGWNTP